MPVQLRHSGPGAHIPLPMQKVVGFESISRSPKASVRRSGLLPCPAPQPRGCARCSASTRRRPTTPPAPPHAFNTQPNPVLHRVAGGQALLGQPLSARRLALSVALEAATASDPSKRRDRLARPHDLRYGNRRAGKKVLLDGKQEPRRFQAARLSRATSRPGDKRPPRPGNQRPRGRELSSFVDRP